MGDINEIDGKLTELWSGVSEIAQKMIFKVITEFKIADANQSIPFNDLKYPGIYLIEIKNCRKFLDFNSWIFDFQEKWQHSDYKGYHTPSIKKKRIKATKSFNDWIPLYIGKSKDINSRVYTHINQPREKTMFAMKLGLRTNLLGDIFRLSTIHIDVKNYDWIVPVIESELRKKINPLTGKQ